MKTALELQLQKYVPLLFDHLGKIVPTAPYPLSLLFDAARYSLLSDGKRLRAIIPLLVTESAMQETTPFLDVVCALELIHTYSLIHDDLPSMDNDDFRRGKPSLHKAYSESTAILTGDFLLTYAFEILSTQSHLSDSQKIKLIHVLSSCSGGHGLIGGQILDLFYEKKQLSLIDLEDIYEKKTANLFICAFAFGGILINADETLLHHLKLIGKHFGILYQYADDLHDVVSDLENNKLNYTNRFSKEELICRLEVHFNALETSIRKIPFSLKVIEEFISNLKEELTSCKM